MLKVYNTLTRKKEEFVPIEGKKVNVFVCGPTIYSDSHIGHGKTYTQFDVIVRYLRWKGFKVFYLMNITDIDDKIINKASEGIDGWKDITKKYERDFYEDMRALGNDSVDEFARATDHVQEIIKQIEVLIEKGIVYETSDGFYFEIAKFEEYGNLSKQNLEQIKKGARVDINKEKKDHADFVVWKKEKPGEPVWDAPFGKGRPGWHIEDTAITEKYFGPYYDLHGGAMDLIFPHHECEIAIMESVSGRKPLVNYWLHTAFLNMGKDKMSKSIGNIISIREALKKWNSKELRYFYAVNHYRTPIDYTDESIEHAKNALDSLNNFIQNLYSAKGSGADVEELIDALMKKFEEHMDNDFDSPGAIASLFDFVHKINKSDVSKEDADKILKALQDFNSVFKFLNFEKVEVPKEIQILVDKREAARKNKDWKTSDKIRDKIKEKGYLVEDSPSGSIVKKSKRNELLERQEF